MMAGLGSVALCRFTHVMTAGWRSASVNVALGPSNRYACHVCYALLACSDGCAHCLPFSLGVVGATPGVACPAPGRQVEDLVRQLGCNGNRDDVIRFKLAGCTAGAERLHGADFGAEPFPPCGVACVACFGCALGPAFTAPRPAGDDLATAQAWPTQRHCLQSA